ncbi:MAG TPA: YciI family protein [Gemmatimonadales bacterium]|nr:YciI family protein [Gemmatimonadales bacterium]
MKFIALVYIDPTLMSALPAGEEDAWMRDCLSKADTLKENGALLASQILEDAATAKSIRVRAGRTVITDGPFAEAKEVLGGFNLIEAETMEEALGIARSFPWAATGCIEVRPVRDIEAVRRRVMS